MTIDELINSLVKVRDVVGPETIVLVEPEDDNQLFKGGPIEIIRFIGFAKDGLIEDDNFKVHLVY